MVCVHKVYVRLLLLDCWLNCSPFIAPVENWLQRLPNFLGNFFTGDDFTKTILKRNVKGRSSILTWIIHHDNAPSLTLFAAAEFLTTYNVVILTKVLYSSDLAPIDFFCTSITRTTLKRSDLTRFQEDSTKSPNSLAN